MHKFSFLLFIALNFYPLYAQGQECTGATLNDFLEAAEGVADDCFFSGGFNECATRDLTAARSVDTFRAHFVASCCSEASQDLIVSCLNRMRSSLNSAKKGKLLLLNPIRRSLLNEVQDLLTQAQDTGSCT